MVRRGLSELDHQRRGRQQGGSQANKPVGDAILADHPTQLAARDTGDFAKALELLRHNAGYLDSAVVALMRGRIWSQAGEPEIARDYFRQARTLDSLHANADFLWLDALSRIPDEEDLARVSVR